MHCTHLPGACPAPSGTGKRLPKPHTFSIKGPSLPQDPAFLIEKISRIVLKSHPCPHTWRWGMISPNPSLPRSPIPDRYDNIGLTQDDGTGFPHHPFPRAPGAPRGSRNFFHHRWHDYVMRRP
ncbi:hypothetical protein PAXRUDRAFT_519827 [Paxillus rubicundulus Ve08.2h10]|uniref:Unplaced genomic scaffold scaffold_370, whole genome shotgun sequence n=1 Tax=Paxillus rubicundulus Ve08.2h10 TaxID=930991 RepID=A0A0D0D8P6_9AGAM|nr:hypothetical protein PAXRUDRAFT_519827 [Paxillus rubicundulus Ve08.2h10]